MHAALGPGEVHVWFRTTGSTGAADVQAARATLSGAERQRADRFHFTEDCRDYTLAHDLLRRALSTYRPVAPDGWRFQADGAGKPFLADDPKLSFNLSHTRQLVACAIAAGPPVGIDVERAVRVLDAAAIAGRYFSSDESAALARCGDEDRTMRFVELWTLKEAFVKAVGAGLAMPLDAMSFALDQGQIVFEPPPGYAASEWHFALFAPSGEGRMAVAVRAAFAPSFIAREISSGRLASGAAELHPARLTRTRIAVP
jgi:phosphopantetheine--protein transferase-like protein